MHVSDVNRVLAPLYELGDARELNGRVGTRLAELILPHTAADLTVREVLDLLQQATEEAVNQDKRNGT